MYKCSDYRSQIVRFWHSHLAELYLNKLQNHLGDHNALDVFDQFTRDLSGSFPHTEIKANGSARATPLLKNLRAQCKSKKNATRLGQATGGVLRFVQSRQSPFPNILSQVGALFLSPSESSQTRTVGFGASIKLLGAESIH